MLGLFSLKSRLVTTETKMCAYASLDVVLKNGLVILFGFILLGGSRLVITENQIACW